jgi:hypothetical protein
MKINGVFLLIFFVGTFFNLTNSLLSEERDPFLSPFEPRKVVPKKTIEEISEEKTKLNTIDKPTSVLEANAVKEIKKFLNSNQPEKAEPILVELKKSLADKTLSEPDITVLSDFEDQIKNFSKYKEFLKTTRELMTVQGKIILNDKKNILLINNQPVAEGEDLTDLLKLESNVFLNQVKEDSFSLRYKDIILSFHID